MRPYILIFFVFHGAHMPTHRETGNCIILLQADEEALPDRMKELPGGTMKLSCHYGENHPSIRKPSFCCYEENPLAVVFTLQ